VLIALGSVRPPAVEAGWPLLVVGGLLVGFGARLANAGVLGSIYGAAQRSRRAVAAILAILAGAAVSFVLRQVLGAGGAA